MAIRRLMRGTRRRSSDRSEMELLERRTFLSAAISNINISKLAGNQAEGSIVVDRADATKLFAVSNIDVGDGLMAATSDDGGVTWNRRIIASGKDGLPAACCDPSATFDSFGNLFLAYLNNNTNEVVVLESTDAGQDFTLLTKY